MKNYEPTFDMRETAKNIRFFLQAHKKEFWKIFKPLAFYIAALYLIDAIISGLYSPDKKNGFFLGSILASYFYTALTISWHKLIIQGKEGFVPMNPFKPKKNEIRFLLTGVFLTVAVILSIAGIFAAVSAFLNAIPLYVSGNDMQAFIKAVVIFMTSFSLIIGGIFILYKFSFYFPSKAVNGTLTLKQSFLLTRGYFTKLLCVPFLVSWRLLLALMLVGLIVGSISFMVFYFAAINSPDIQAQIQAGKSINLGLWGSLMGYIMLLPNILFFQPVLLVIGVTALSNYYMHAMQNRNDSVIDS